MLTQLGEVASRIEENSVPDCLRSLPQAARGETEVETTLWKESWRELLGKRTFHCAHIFCLTFRASDVILLVHSFGEIWAAFILLEVY